MAGLAWVIIIGVPVALFIIVTSLGKQRNNRLVEEGKIINRDISFVESAQIFILKKVDFPTVVSTLKAMDVSSIGLSWESKGATKTVFFSSSHGWSAQLLAQKSEVEQSIYYFQFTHWKTRHSIPWRVDTMNMLLTVVEKVFLSLDPSTQVQTTGLKIKTKTDIL